MGLYTPPRTHALQVAYDVGWQSVPDAGNSMSTREHAALRKVAHAVEEEVAEDLESLVDSWDDHVTCEDVLSAISEIARELRSGLHE